MTRKQYMKKYGKCNRIKVGLYLKTHNKKKNEKEYKIKQWLKACGEL